MPNFDAFVGSGDPSPEMAPVPMRHRELPLGFPLVLKRARASLLLSR
jgi:hypothetical protein